ncbi:MAG: DNA-directed RNA polymerase subunit beta' [Verrucomicrobiia bacterium AMD-G2]|nr:MAG: DNA-directed RNA polymerase subunit beta' [Verrucomicrobiae bacterium AMD-G2]
MSVENNLRELFGVEEKTEQFDQIAITVAAPDIIRSWSKGEVKNPETINYRTFKPEKGGLFCERIFGPTRDWECACGKYKRIKHKGVVCDRCGVEVTLSRVRRERMGHIELAVPVSHIWYYKCMPSRIGLMLDITARQLERIIYYEDFVVTDVGTTNLTLGQLLTETELREAEDAYGESAFRARMGAEAIQDLLSQVDLPSLMVDLQQQLAATRSKQNRKKLAKRLKITQGFHGSRSRPEWMVLNVLPVIPPDLRPLVPLEGGRFATSDLNDLYRRVINRNNRLKNLLQLKTPDVIIRNEKRMLQEAVDALFDNGRHGRAVTGAGNRPLKSLSDMLKGKGGRFRQNLLGKRVDYSGRSVIVIGPDLKLNQCGLPKKMALALFEPFIIRRLKELGYCHTVRSAKKMIDRKTKEVWDILADVTKGHPILLNRAPTLHRLSIQGFEPKLIEGEAIRVHPLVCTAFNADFDGDQMAVHVPLSVEAQMECRQLMLAPNNIFSPASGRPITVPSQDIILGSYYLTWAPIRTEKDREKKEHLPLFESTDEVEFAIASKKLGYHSWIRIRNKDFGKDTHYGIKDAKIIETTPGRVRFNEIWPDGMGFINHTVGKKQMSDVIWRCYQVAGQKGTVETLDALKNLGFREASRSGCSVGIVDMLIPEEKPAIIDNANIEVEKVTKQYRNGIITDGERKEKVIGIWTQASDQIANHLYRKIEHNEGKAGISPLFMMVDSGARGNKNQIKQLGGMRGLMAKPSGEIIERPITSNFREGLTVLEYFISTHGARKGLSDTALKTADSGYMTRKLVDVAQDVIIFEEDCGTVSGISVAPIYDGDEEMATLPMRIYGRVSLQKVVDPLTGETVVDVDEIISEKASNAIEKLNYDKFRIRSVLTCESKRGCCVKCYGLNLATMKPAKLGEAVGIVAAQSIGEPGTQLTMRTFHIGGVASSAYKQPIINAKNSGQLVYKDLRVANSSDGWVVLNKNGYISVRNKDGLELESHPIVVGALIHTQDGEDVKKGQLLATWDQYSVPILTEKAGKVEFRDMIKGITIKTDTDKETGKKAIIVTEHKEDLHPQVCIIAPESVKKYKSVVTERVKVITSSKDVVSEIFKHNKELADRISASSVKSEKDKMIKFLDHYGLKYFEPGEYDRKDIIAENSRRKKLNFPFKIPSEDIVEKVYDGEESREVIVAQYSIPVGAQLTVSEGQKIAAGVQIAKTPRKASKTKDITGGLPRVADLFEARSKPSEACVIAKIDGIVSFGNNIRAKKRLIVTDDVTSEEMEHLVPMGKHIIVTEGDRVSRGDHLTEGAVSPSDLLEACGARELQEHLVNEVQSVYRAQGVEINDKHIEVIVRQMLRKVKITDPGDADDFLWGDQVEKTTFQRINEQIIANGGKPAEGEPVLLGITKASLETESFISAASFQDTTRVLTEASTLGKVDYLMGFKENVIMGHLIPAGTGFSRHRDLEVEFTVEEPEPIFVAPEEDDFREEDESAITA